MIMEMYDNGKRFIYDRKNEEWVEIRPLRLIINRGRTPMKERKLRRKV